MKVNLHVNISTLIALDLPNKAGRLSTMRPACTFLVQLRERALGLVCKKVWLPSLNTAQASPIYGPICILQRYVSHWLNYFSSLAELRLQNVRRCCFLDL